MIDLTQPVNPGMQVYPGDPEVRFGAAARLAEDGVAVAALRLGTHTGTHVDAPSHLVAGGATIDQLPLSRFAGPARVVRLAPVAARSRIDLGRVADRLGEPVAGEVVLFRTDWSRHFGTPGYFDHPFLDPAIAGYLLASGVRTVGIDALSPDPTPAPGGPAGPPALPFHRAFLGGGGVIVENLTNLAALEGRRVWFAAWPWRLSGLDGSPVRAVATELEP